MALRFPEVEDIPLRAAPLANVVCQVRFPTILAITRGHPIDFQEAIRHRFPEIEAAQELAPQVSSDGEQLAVPGFAIRSFQFLTSDRSVTASLTVDFWAIATTAYTVWDRFADDLQLVSNAAVTAYGMPHAQRVGLRYVNQFDAASTGFTDSEDLVGLLRPELVALFQSSTLKEPIQAVSQVTVAEAGVNLTIRIALLPRSDDQEATLYLDFDCFEEEQIDLATLTDRCRRYHDLVYRAFRWALAPDTLNLFDPTPAER